MKELVIPKSVTDRSDVCIKDYLRDISKYPLISQEEEKILSKKIKNGDEEALHKLVNSNLRFVVSVAKQYQCANMSLIDLINEGNYGMIQAAKRFDGERGFKFISYAVWWIRQAIIEAISTKSKSIRIPNNQVILINKLSKAIASFEQRYGRTPTNIELSELLQLDEDKISELMSYMVKIVSADVPFDDTDSDCLIDVIPNTSNYTDQNLIKDSNSYDLDSILKNLSDREYDILQMTFGLNGVQELTFDEIGKRFNMTGERIRQIKESCLNYLRENYPNELKTCLL